jgi:hypothetical protein
MFVKRRDGLADFFVIDTLGLQTGNTVLSAYIVDNYPEHANEVITFYTVIINVGLTSPPSPTSSLSDANTTSQYSSQHSSIPGLFTTGSRVQVSPHPLFWSIPTTH